MAALLAVWHRDEKEALRLAQEYNPRGSAISPRIVSPLSEGVLRGLKLEPGQAGVLQAFRPYL